MKINLLQFLSKYATFSEEDIHIIETQNIVKEYNKGTVLLSEGQQAKDCFLVLNGCVRSYYLKDGEEKNIDFFLENDPIVPVSYVRNEPSHYFIECMEDCVLSNGNSDRTEKFLQSFPQFAPLFRKISDDLLANQQISSDTFRNLTPEEHYLKIRELKPALLERIPQYHMASYLGIKPQSLSRIRKRLTRSK